MLHLLLMTVFVVVMAYCQAINSRKIVVYNSKIAEGEPLNEPLKKDRGIFMIITMIVMMLLAAFRSINVGNDTDEYIRIFNEILSNPDYANITRYEVGYIFLNKFVGKFTFNPQGIIIVTAVIYYTVFIWFYVKHSKNYSLTLILFFCLMFDSTLTMIRQELAMAFILVSFDRILDKKHIEALIWIIIASLFHSSAIIMVILLFLPYIKFDKIWVIGILLICFLLAFTNVLYKVCQLILPAYAHYFGGKYSESGWLAITYKICYNLAFFILVSLAIYKLGRDKCNLLDSRRLNCIQKNNLILWMMFIAFAILIIGYKINLVDRFLYYFIGVSIVCTSNTLLKYDTRSRKIITILMVTILIAYSIIVIKIRPEWNIIYPYTFFWQVT